MAGTYTQLFYHFVWSTKNREPLLTPEVEAAAFAAIRRKCAEFKAIVQPNNDTLYSLTWLDLRTEPMVIGVPEIKDQRYYTVQLVDLYTHNVGYLGARTTGFSKGYYLIAGPTWSGEKPARITAVVRSEGNLVHGIVRFAVQGPADVSNVRALQKRFSLAPLSKFLGRPAPKRVPIDSPPFLQKWADGAGFILPSRSTAGGCLSRAARLAQAE